jgi:hypothetical protein
MPISCRIPQRLPVPAEFCRSLPFFLGHYIDTAQLVSGFSGNSAGPICFFFSIFYWCFLSFSKLFCYPVRFYYCH